VRQLPLIKALTEGPGHFGVSYSTNNSRINRLCVVPTTNPLNFTYSSTSYKGNLKGLPLIKVHLWHFWHVYDGFSEVHLTSMKGFEEFTIIMLGILSLNCKLNILKRFLEFLKVVMFHSYVENISLIISFFLHKFLRPFPAWTDFISFS